MKTDGRKEGDEDSIYGGKEGGEDRQRAELILSIYSLIGLCKLFKNLSCKVKRLHK